MAGAHGDEEAAKRQTFLRAGFDGVTVGLALWDDFDRLVLCNEAFSQRFAFMQSQLGEQISHTGFLKTLVGSGLLVTPLSRQDWLEKEHNACLVNATSEYLFTDGSSLRVERRSLPGLGRLTSFHDITLARRTEIALEKARDAATASDQTKSRFLRAANHDLRQPLAALKILIYNCMAAEDAAEREHLLHAMDVSVSIMEDLLGALLNIGQLDAGKIEPKISTFQVSTLFDRIRLQFAHQARELGLELRVVSSAYALKSDRSLLERIVSNFVGNALRYTETGGVVVGCRRSGKFVKIEVWDSGCGIDEDHHETIFGEFFRISETQVYRKHSLGLGLNICKRLAAMLDHDIAVRSTPGKGSVFSVKVPVGNIWHSDIGEPEISERIGGEFTGLLAVVLEDDSILREALVSLLDRWGMDVLSIESLESVPLALQDLEREPDLIITDYRLRGGVQGTDIAGQINDCLEKPCPAIVVTADTDPELIENIRRQGFPVLIKPVSPPSLRVMMHNILYEPGLVQELHR
ncbi:MAG: hypothetical protein Kilf2KO_24090 [Rhodospirillales bacterium]